MGNVMCCSSENKDGLSNTNGKVPMSSQEYEDERRKYIMKKLTKRSGDTVYSDDEDEFDSNNAPKKQKMRLRLHDVDIESHDVKLILEK